MSWEESRKKAKHDNPARVLCEALDINGVVLFSATAELIAVIQGIDLVLRPAGNGSVEHTVKRHVLVYRSRLSFGHWEIFTDPAPEELWPRDTYVWWPRSVTITLDYNPDKEKPTQPNQGPRGSSFSPGRPSKGLFKRIKKAGSRFLDKTLRLP